MRAAWLIVAFVGCSSARGVDPSRVGAGVHPAGFGNPRIITSHVQQLRSTRWAPMLDANDAFACGRCHDGVPSRPVGTMGFAPGATACTTCHSEPNGIFACATCHAKDVPHRAHTEPSASSASGLACGSCHPQPEAGHFDGAHTNGAIEIWMTGTFDPASKRCAGTCHARGGARPEPAWTDTPTAMTCNDCHRSPPANHYAGACSSCHREANDNGTALVSPKLHVDGKVDLGDGSGKCGACHGTGDDPWPTTGAHAAHERPSAAAPVACETCHDLPKGKHPSGKGIRVRLFGLASSGARNPKWDPQTKTCASTYCHDGSGASQGSPKWSDGKIVSACGGCHSLPPLAPHSPGASCSQVTCHAGSTSLGMNGLALTMNGAKVHVNGLVDRNVP